MAKKYYGSTKSMRKKDSQSFIYPNKREYAMLPNEVIMREFPPLAYFDNDNYGDTMKSVDRTMNENVRTYKKGRSRRRF